jgi:hypothetical protein
MSVSLCLLCLCGSVCCVSCVWVTLSVVFVCVFVWLCLLCLCDSVWCVCGLCETACCVCVILSLFCLSGSVYCVYVTLSDVFVWLPRPVVFVCLCMLCFGLSICLALSVVFVWLFLLCLCVCDCLLRLPPLNKLQVCVIFEKTELSMATISTIQNSIRRWFNLTKLHSVRPFLAHVQGAAQRFRYCTYVPST